MFFDTLRCPRYSAPLWVWSIIGGVYYAIFGFVAFRLLSAVPPSLLARAAVALIVAMMFANCLANLVIFRARNLHLSYLIGCGFAGFDLLLAVCCGSTALPPQRWCHISCTGSTRCGGDAHWPDSIHSGEHVSRRGHAPPG